MNLDVDVAVVGAGPAGSSAAAILAARGVRVALIDRASFPRAKVCGDGLTPRALANLARLGVWDDVQPFAQHVGGLSTVNLRSGATWMGPIPSRVPSGFGRGAVVRRDVLDEILCRRAVRSGARFSGGVTVEAIETRRANQCTVHGRLGRTSWTCRSSVVILANGAGGRLARSIPGAVQPMLEGIAMRQYWRHVAVEPTFTICVPLEIDGRQLAGYGWIFPVAQDVANVGVGLYGVHEGRTVRQVYASFTRRLRELQHGWVSAEACGPLQGGLLWSGCRPSELVQGRLVRAGDAAGMTNPFTGEGIAQALDSGEVAALAVMDEFEAPGCLASVIERRTQAKFPETTRMAAHLPWLVSHGEQFVTEFWEAISPARAIVTRAARRVALEERIGPARSDPSSLVAQTWASLGREVAGDFPVLAILLEAIREESEIPIDPALEAFWGTDDGHRVGEMHDVALLLGLAVLQCLVIATGVEAHEIAAGTVSEPRPPRTKWAINALTLGAADILMAHFFVVSARLPSAVATACGRSLAMALERLWMCADEPVTAKGLPGVLEALGNSFRVAACMRVAKAA